MLYPDFRELMELGVRTPGMDLAARRKAVSVMTGDYKSPFRGRGLEFEEVRAYAPGDDVRNIDWRVTARTGRPHLKLYSEDRERSVLVCIDRNDSMRFGTRVTFKSIQAARAAALIGWAAVRDNDRIGSSLFGNVPEGQRFFGPRRSRRSLWRMLKLFATKKTTISSRWPSPIICSFWERPPLQVPSFLSSATFSISATISKNVWPTFMPALTWSSSP
jgi:uncharacterized protein (DUF58 family)